MAQQWEVERAHGVCAETGRAIVEGEEFFSALFEDGESFRRADYSVEGWSGPPTDSFCHFKSRVPVKEKRKKLLVDNEMLVSFFVRLAEESELIRIQFRFVLALILMRKRILRYEGSSTNDGQEVWDMTLPRDHSRHRVVNPRLSEEEVESVSKQLNTILHADMAEWTDQASNDSVGEMPNDGEATVER